MQLTGSTVNFVAADWLSQIVVSSDCPIFLTHQNTSHFCSFILLTDLQECISILLQFGSTRGFALECIPSNLVTVGTGKYSAAWRSPEESPKSPFRRSCPDHLIHTLAFSMNWPRVRKETQQSPVLWKQRPEQFSSKMGGLQNIGCGALAHWFHNP